TGSPDGLWRVEVANWSGIGMMVPRNRYTSLRDESEIQGPGVYVLVGPAETSSPFVRVYVGESDVLRKRLDSHFQQKDFWTRVIVFASKDSNLNKAHVRYLEHRLVSKALKGGRAEVENGSAPSQPSLSEVDKSDAEAFLDRMLLILPILGITAFEEAGSSSSKKRAHLYLSGKGANGTGQETPDGFVVFANSIARPDTVPSMQNFGLSLRDALIRDGILVPDNEGLRLVQDYVFTSPSTAAIVLLGRSANGREEWKDDKGRTLKAIQEAQLESTPD
ncbi:MAG: GIY-YIG nuclease family protein, partial [Actinomycetota bacterium]